MKNNSVLWILEKNTALTDELKTSEQSCRMDSLSGNAFCARHLSRFVGHRSCAHENYRKTKPKAVKALIYFWWAQGAHIKNGHMHH